MTLWVLCEHNKLEPHVTGWVPLPRSGIREAIVCLGGRQATPEDLIEALGGEKVALGVNGVIAEVDRLEKAVNQLKQPVTTRQVIAAVLLDFNERGFRILIPVLDQEKE